MNISQEAKTVRDRLLLRAEFLAKIRDFFQKRQVLEVTTPLLLSTTNPAPYLHSFNCDGLYLQTSPEFAMKELLANGSGDVYQICKAFRQGEIGSLHNPEFTILEWYRIDFNHHDLMDEVEELLNFTIGCPKAQRCSYLRVCEEFLAINPHTVTLKQLKQLVRKNDLLISGLDDDIATWMQLIFTHLIEPKLDTGSPIFIYDFPASQAMLARIHGNKIKLASRFEVYYRGVELANGFHELNDPQEQRQRFNCDLAKRRQLGLPSIPPAEKFLAALSKLPNCSGVAIGVDRLLLLAIGASSLDEVL